MANQSTLNICSVADAIQFLVQHEDKLTSTEKKGITDPLITARTVLRRILGKTFDKFEIRKNSDHYSLRCEDPDIYKVVYLYHLISTQVGYLERVHPDLMEQIRECTEPLRAFLGRNTEAVWYRFRDEQRFFLYVSFLPYTSINRRDCGNVEYFNLCSLSARLSVMEQIANTLKDLRINDAGERFMNFIIRFGRYCIGSIRMTSANRTPITDEFITYALAHQSSNLANIYNEFTLAQARPAVLPNADERPATEARRTRTANARPTISPRLDDASADEQQRFRDALNRVRGQAQPAPEEQENIFMEALTRVRQRENPQDDRFFDIRPDGEAAVLDLFGSAEDSDNYIDDERYIMLLHEIGHTDVPGFTTTSVDVFDDFDTERHGLYFKTEGYDIIYSIYNENVLILETRNYEEALGACLMHGLRCGEIRYLEG